MKKLLIIPLMLIVLQSALMSQDLAKASSRTAFLIPAKSLDVGLFQPIRLGYSDNIELSTHPIAFFLAPNLQMKNPMDFGKISKLHLSILSFYPTPLLKMISREGTGGIIAKEFKDDIPQMFSFYNGLLLSKQINSKYIISFKGGLKFAVNSGDLDARTSIDLPLVYPRMQAFYEGFGLQYGMNVTAHIAKRFYSDTNIEFFHFPTADENFAVEYSALYSWLKESGFQVSAGYKLIYGKYPFGNQWHLLPMFDIKWKIR